LGLGTAALGSLGREEDTEGDPEPMAEMEK
jgi:hypothetical protein